nr:MAG TPA: hypothetical protein [Microviridae sp.]
MSDCVVIFRILLRVSFVVTVVAVILRELMLNCFIDLSCFVIISKSLLSLLLVCVAGLIMILLSVLLRRPLIFLVMLLMSILKVLIQKTLLSFGKKISLDMLITVRKTWVIAPMSKCKKVKKSEKKC